MLTCCDKQKISTKNRLCIIYFNLLWLWDKNNCRKKISWFRKECVQNSSIKGTIHVKYSQVQPLLAIHRLANLAKNIHFGVHKNIISEMRLIFCLSLR